LKREALRRKLAKNDMEGGDDRLVDIAAADQELLVATFANGAQIGTTRSRVSFFMNKFRKLGLIDYNGSIEVHSSLLNVVLHDEPHINT
jgi:hypothetical protein